MVKTDSSCILSSTLKRLLASHLFKFLLVGGLATGVQFVMLVVFVELLATPKVLASAGAYGCGAIVNYLLNYYFTFRSDKPHVTAFGQFVVVVAIGITINTLSFSLFALVIHYVAAQVIATLITLVANFLFHKFWIYKHH